MYKRKWPRTKVSFGWCDGCQAYCYTSNGEIFVNLKRGNPLKSYLHELLHMKYPNKPHTWIYHMESKLWHEMSQKERFLLGKRLFNRKYKKEKEEV